MILLAGLKTPLLSLVAKELSDWQIPFITISDYPEFQTLPAERFDAIISLLGFETGVHQKNNLTNKLLLQIAITTGVRKFILVAMSDHGGGNQNTICLLRSFYGDLMTCSIKHTIIHRNVFYGELQDVLMAAKAGKVYLFGNGEFKINPIHITDFAEICVQSISHNEKEIRVGGPDILTQNEIAEMAFHASGNAPHIIHLPRWSKKVVLITSGIMQQAYRRDQITGFLAKMDRDQISERHGKLRLQDYFYHEIEQQNNINYY